MSPRITTSKFLRRSAEIRSSSERAVGAVGVGAADDRDEADVGVVLEPVLEELVLVAEEPFDVEDADRLRVDAEREVGGVVREQALAGLAGDARGEDEGAGLGRGQGQAHRLLGVAGGERRPAAPANDSRPRLTVTSARVAGPPVLVTVTSTLIWLWTIARAGACTDRTARSSPPALRVGAEADGVDRHGGVGQLAEVGAAGVVVAVADQHQRRQRPGAEPGDRLVDGADQVGPLGVGLRVGGERRAGEVEHVHLDAGAGRSSSTACLSRSTAAFASSNRDGPLGSASDIDAELSSTTATRPGSTRSFSRVQVGLASASTSAASPAARRSKSHQISRRPERR